MEGRGAQEEEIWERGGNIKKKEEGNRILVGDNVGKGRENSSHLEGYILIKG